MNQFEASQVAEKFLGFPGCMLSYNKSQPGIVYNSNVCTKTHGKIWFGDIKIEPRKNLDVIKGLAKALGESVYILREMDARFNTETEPRFEKAVVTIDTEGNIYEGGI